MLIIPEWVLTVLPEHELVERTVFCGLYEMTNGGNWADPADLTETRKWTRLTACGIRDVAQELVETGLVEKFPYPEAKYRVNVQAVTEALGRKEQ